MTPIAVSIVRSRLRSSSSLLRVCLSGAVLVALTLASIGCNNTAPARTCQSTSDCFEGEVCDPGRGVCVEEVSIDVGVSPDGSPTDVRARDGGDVGDMPDGQSLDTGDALADGVDRGDTEGSDAADGGDDTCNYRGQLEGVCGEAELLRPNEDRPDAGGDATADTTRSPVDDAGLDRRETGICRRPEAYESPTDSETCDGLDNDCDGAVDEGCGCIYDPSEPDRIDTDQSNASGACINQVRDAEGVCQTPDNFDDTDDESSVGDGELCDGVDNDCDGAVDEGCGCTYDPDEPQSVDSDDSNASGVCPGQTRDSQGRCQMPSNYDSTNDESAAGLCNGIDNDCDGAIDEGCGCTYDPSEPNNVDEDRSNNAGVCPDQTRDGSGTCQAPRFYDGNDDEADANRCGDGRDNDCDGTVDEGCSCNFQGNSDGVCGDSTIDPNTGQCGEPADYNANDDEAEAGLCDGLDNDCDGAVDEGCDCDYQDNSTGVCSDPTRDSQGDCQEPSNYQSPTAQELACDGLDNDCDGVVDEGCKCNYQSNSKGVCGEAELDGSGQCEEPNDYRGVDNEANVQLCDGLDNDCDGVVDENCPCNYNSTSKGVCGQATIDPSTGQCGEPADYDGTDDESSAGLCDAKDNDCDGTVDEGCSCQDGTTEDCYTGPSGTAGVGVCEKGERTCTNGSFGACSSETTPSNETCDGRDNDCDGTTDEGCACDYDSTSIGVCSTGTIADGGNCQPPSNYEPDESSCDGLDNDCDTVTDEGCPCDYDSTSTGVCSDGTISASDGTCQAPNTYESDESSCDGFDNDCDGAVDEGCACTYDPEESRDIDTDASNDTGVCPGQTIASNGTCSEPSGYDGTDNESGAGLCDGLDNDCDGAVDENCPCTYDPSEPDNVDTDDSNDAGVCPGQTINASDGACPEPTEYNGTDNEASAGLCDGIDNDCDGAIDEGCPCTYDPTEENDVDTDGSHGNGLCRQQTRDSNGACQKPSSFEATQNDAESDDSCGALLAVEGRDNDCDGNVDEGCPCVYDPGEPNNVDTDGSNNSGAVCPGQTIDSNRTCRRPRRYDDSSAAEQTNDNLDNDCDGLEDEDTLRAEDPSCLDDDECDSGACVVPGTDLGINRCAHRIFVTSTKFDGDLGGETGADGKCQRAAQRAGLAGDWMAIISSARQTARVRLSLDAAIVNMAPNPEPVAADEEDLWSPPLQNAPRYDEYESQQRGLVWTGTNPDGEVNRNLCRPQNGDAWSSSSNIKDGQPGRCTETNGKWINRGSSLKCNKARRLYCIDGGGR